MCQRRDPAGSGPASETASAEIRASINGRVVEVCVTVGATVAVGDRLVVLEAMKMEHELRATRAGCVAGVGVTPGEQVTPGQWVVRFEGEA
jgi:3-methylcrotonyl-CoA carboxylase alpha subunit